MLKRLLKSKLLGNTAVYALANVINGAIPFLLLPILTRVFTPQEYGLVTLVSAVIAVMGAFTGLSTHGAVSVKYFDKSINHPQFVGASLLVLCGSTTLILLFLLFAGNAISSWINLPKQWLFIAAVASAAQFVINIRLALWQIHNEPPRYGFFQVSQTLFNLGLSLALVFWALWGWEGRTWGIVLSTIMFSFIAIASMHKSSLVSWSRNRDYEAKALAFGLPLIPHVLGGLIIAMSDRFILTSVLGLEAVGQYAVGIQMGMVIAVLTDAFNKAYSPYLFSMLSQKNESNEIKIIQFSYLMFAFFLSLALIYTMILPFLYSRFIGQSFENALLISKIASFSFAFQGMYYVVVNFIFFKESTGKLSSLSLTCGILGILITYKLVHLNGINGAAWALLIIQIIFFAGAWCLSQRVFPLPWIRGLRFS